MSIRISRTRGKTDAAVACFALKKSPSPCGNGNQDTSYNEDRNDNSGKVEEYSDTQQTDA